jgi:alpha-L-rhamnosidase
MSVNCSAPKIEHLTDATGIGTGAPRLSWTVSSPDPAWRQAGYDVSVESSGASDTFAVPSGDQLLVPWPGEPLHSRQRARVRVRVTGEDGTSSEWSSPTTVETGLLERADITARMISARDIGGLDDPAPVFSTTWHSPAAITRARLYITSRGVYRAEINGQRVGDHVLAPGWTAYDHRLLYQTFDVTELVLSGENRIDVTVGNGWYRGNLGRPPRRDLYGDKLGVLAQLELVFADGSLTTIHTDETWHVRSTNILADDLYNGQITDLRGVADAGEQHPVDIVDFDHATLVAPQAPPMRVVAELPAASLITSPSGKTIVDFGQNLVGWVRLRVHDGKRDATVTVRHAEVLEHGELGVRPLRAAQATDTYILGRGEATLEPEFTFHGFRYAEIDGLDAFSLDDVRAMVVSSDLERTGWFECSDPLLNRLHENVIWGMRGNFLSVPTDCPQRDERLGWTGDIQVFAPSAGYLFDTAGFLSNWLEDLAAEQKSDGSVPYVIPDIMRRPAPAAAAWGDAAVIVPWVLYRQFGDVEILRRQFESMRLWVDKIDELSGPDRLWVGGFQYGDWLDPTAPPDDPAKTMTHHDVVATAHFAHSADLVARAARLLGRDADAAHYSRLAAEVAAAFRSTYTTQASLVMSDSQTAYSMAIEWGLLADEDARHRAGDRLADLMRRAGFTIGTGFVGTPLILDALTDTGHVDAAYRLLLQTESPSWLYPITMGATTIWERWDSMLPDGSINPGQMTSFNHYAFGAVVDWMHRVIAGLDSDDAAFRHLVIRPRPGGGLSRAAARHTTPYGETFVSWTRDDGDFSLTLTVPTGSTAHVELPFGGGSSDVEAGTHSWTIAEPDHRVVAPDPSSTTTRGAIDSERTWAQIVELAKAIDPKWTQKALAAAAGQYLDRDVREIARVVGRSIIYRREAEFGEGIERIVNEPN